MATPWKSRRKATIDWRSWLTEEEAAIVDRYYEADAVRRELSPQLAAIRNRAINRAKYRLAKQATGRKR